MTNPHPLGDDGVKMKELLPCPFCGGEPKLVLRSFADDIECQCGASIGGQSAAKVIKAWNRRAVPSPKAEWRSMESAPKDGSEFLFLLERDAIVVGHWDPDKYARKPRPYWTNQRDFFRTSRARENQPIAWQPLPAPPKQEGHAPVSASAEGGSHIPSPLEGGGR